MKIKFSGDFVKLQAFADKVEKAPKSLVTVNVQLAEETLGLIRDGFEQSRDPYGKPWKPPMLRSGRPLEVTGGLKNSWHRSAVSADRFTVANGKQYAIWVNDGTGVHGPRKQRIYPKRARFLKLPGGIFRRSVAGAVARRMVPESGRLPQSWRNRYVETALEVLTEIFR